jgi:hypothetical protein
LAVPAFERLLKGEQESTTLKLSNSKAGTAITVNVNAVIAEVLPKLGLGFVSVKRQLRPATDAEMLAAAEALEQYTKSSQFLTKLRNLHSEIARTGERMLLDDALRALGLPQWVGRLGIAELIRAARHDDHVDAKMLAAELGRLTERVATLESREGR